jgi:hypothetical protein
MEVGRSLPGLDRTEGVFDRATANAHAIAHPIHTFFHGFQHFLVLPTTDPTILARRTLRFDATLRTG